MTKKVWLWFILTFVSSSVFFITYTMFGETWQFISLLLAMTMPAVMVFVVQKIYKQPIKGKFFLKMRFNRFVILGVLTPLLLVSYIVLLNVAITPAVLGLDPYYVAELEAIGLPEQYHMLTVVGSTLLNGIIAGVTLNAIFAFGEELGWRGFLQEEFGYMGPWKSSAIIGAVWGLWHAPLIVQGYNFPDHPYIGVFLMIIATTFLGIIISYLTKRSGTILTAAFFHGVFNAVAALTIILTSGYVDIWHGPFGVTAIVVYATVAGLLFLFEKNRYKKQQKKAEL
jgi:membrane protease YdiL (CAAX protease family)